MDEVGYVVLNLFLFAARVGITVYCVNKAGQLNRSKGGWGVFGFFLPIIALVWIQFMKPNLTWDDQSGQNE